MVTVRERDAMTQIRIPLDGVMSWLDDRLEAAL
jgi:glycyl-tRNA synthetase (class II)